MKIKLYFLFSVVALDLNYECSGIKSTLDWMPSICTTVKLGTDKTEFSASVNNNSYRNIYI